MKNVLQIRKFQMFLSLFFRFLYLIHILKFNQGFAKNVSILYGGSVNAENANDILSLENVDGALVGGTSLKPKDFSKIIDYSS